MSYPRLGSRGEDGEKRGSEHVVGYHGWSTGAYGTSVGAFPS